MEDGKVLVLRCAREDMTSSVNRITGKMFYWPTSGPVSCDDWDPEQVCGNGLHGWLWGMGDVQSCDYWSRYDNKWLVVEVNINDIVQLDGKVKFSKGKVIVCGRRDHAVEYICERAPSGTAVMFANVLAGNHEAAVAGDYGSASTGDHGMAVAKKYGSAKAGYQGTAIVGWGGTAMAENHGTAIAGNGGTAIAKDYGKASAGHEGKAVVGNFGTARVGSDGQAEVQKNGTAYVGLHGTVKAGHDSVIHIEYYDKNLCMNRFVSGRIGAGGLCADVWYRLSNEGNFKPVSSETINIYFKENLNGEK